MVPDATDVVMFWKPAGRYAALSQWFRCSFVYDGISFTSRQQFMLYKKAELFNDTELRQYIIENPEPERDTYQTIKRKTWYVNREVWKRHRVEIVTTSCILKFTQNPQAAEVLLGTQDKLLIGTCDSDTTWGVGYSSRNALDNYENWTANNLGKVLTYVRGILRCSSNLPRSLDYK